MKTGRCFPVAPDPTAFASARGRRLLLSCAPKPSSAKRAKRGTRGGGVEHRCPWHGVPWVAVVKELQYGLPCFNNRSTIGSTIGGQQCTGLRRRISAAIFGWDRPSLTFIYPGFDCDSNGFGGNMDQNLLYSGGLI